MKSLILSALIAVGACSAGDEPAPAQVERDHILSLTAMAIVHRDWQRSPGGRGHNIGALLVDGNSRPVFWARNAVGASGDATQHGEARLIQEFLNCPAVGRYADGFTVYTTLEPCAMCTGMMSLARVSRTVYVQTDPEYGNARDALARIGYPTLHDEYSPSGLTQKKLLDTGYKDFKKGNPDRSVVEYLLSAEAERIFASAETELDRYVPKFRENARVLESTRAFLKKVPKGGGDDRLLEYCPAK